MSAFLKQATKELQFTQVGVGSRGLAVRRLQEWLTLRGYPVPIDAAFAGATERELDRFRKKIGSSAAGALDAKTWDELTSPLRALVALKAADVQSSTESGSILAAARAHLAAAPREVGGQNAGPWVRVYMQGNEGADWPWCAGFVVSVIEQATSLRAESSPVKSTFSCDSLAHHAKAAGRFVPGASIASGVKGWPKLGACQIFLVRRSPSDWTHCGFSFSGKDSTFKTIEGNTNDSGHREGYEVTARTRSLEKKDFIVLDPA
jgi:hypothetical protein